MDVDKTIASGYHSQPKLFIETAEVTVFLLPVVIFLAEMCVVTLNTLRTIFVARGNKVLAPLLGFFEVLIWLFAITKVMQNLDKATCAIAFALGFTLGNFLGLLIEKKLALGMAIVRIITNRPPHALIDQLRAAQFGVTSVEGRGATGPVQVVMTVVKRRQLEEVFDLIEAHHQGAFYAVDELQSASEGIFPERRSGAMAVLPAALRFVRPFRARAVSVQER
jgi:uncharacterized protein YebE (UPF0316 family)